VRLSTHDLLRARRDPRAPILTQCTIGVDVVDHPPRRVRTLTTHCGTGQAALAPACQMHVSGRPPVEPLAPSPSTARELTHGRAWLSFALRTNSIIRIAASVLATLSDCATEKRKRMHQPTGVRHTGGGLCQSAQPTREPALDALDHSGVLVHGRSDGTHNVSRSQWFEGST